MSVRSLNSGKHLRRLWVNFASDTAGAISNCDVTEEGSIAAVVKGCLAAGLTATELGDEFKVSTSTISRWRSGRSVPTLLVREVVCKRLAAMLQKKVSAFAGS